MFQTLCTIRRTCRIVLGRYSHAFLNTTFMHYCTASTLLLNTCRADTIIVTRSLKPGYREIALDPLPFRLVSFVGLSVHPKVQSSGSFSDVVAISRLVVVSNVITFSAIKRTTDSDPCPFWRNLSRIVRVVAYIFTQ